jgi:hypothetical protein
MEKLPHWAVAIDDARHSPAHFWPQDVQVRHAIYSQSKVDIRQFYVVAVSLIKNHNTV